MGLHGRCGGQCKEVDTARGVPLTVYPRRRIVPLLQELGKIRLWVEDVFISAAVSNLRNVGEFKQQLPN